MGPGLGTRGALRLVDDESVRSWRATVTTAAPPQRLWVLSRWLKAWRAAATVRSSPAAKHRLYSCDRGDDRARFAAVDPVCPSFVASLGNVEGREYTASP